MEGDFLQFHINALTKNLASFQHIFENWDNGLITWSLNDKSWSVLEVVCHLLDEEREDFRLRLKTIFDNPEAPLQAIDPEGWVVSRAYKSQNFNEVKEAFYQERRASIALLSSLSPSDKSWQNAQMHPHFGKVTPIYFLNNWLAHDYLHIRQLTRIEYDYLQRSCENALEYAGSWK